MGFGAEESIPDWFPIPAAACGFGLALAAFEAWPGLVAPVPLGFGLGIPAAPEVAGVMGAVKIFSPLVGGGG